MYILEVLSWRFLWVLLCSFARHSLVVMVVFFSLPGCHGSVSSSETIDCGYPSRWTWRSHHKVSAVVLVGILFFLIFFLSVHCDNMPCLRCCCRPLPQEEMKNIIFNVFGEDMSTGVVTQVKCFSVIITRDTWSISYRILLQHLTPH